MRLKHLKNRTLYSELFLSVGFVLVLLAVRIKQSLAYIHKALLSTFKNHNL
ncbi:hypothetical protein [Maribacter sp. 2307UL18-2]|uniref:hypothetical protein n=1 Tax=Maribacter sp. 2307UL18-2 TaxID=3386274 RepID=UPI0039BD87DE